MFPARLFILGCISVFSCFLATAQEKFGSINGKVTTSDKNPAPNVTVLIKSTKYGTATDNDGSFEFHRLKPGDYTLKISLLGHKDIEQVITIVGGKTIEPVFVLELTNNQLQEVIITAGKNKFMVKKSQTIAKMPLSNLENPQVYSSISRELIKEQLLTDFGNALKNTPGVYKIQGNRGINTEGASYYVVRGFRTEVAMIDGVPAQTNGEIDPSYVEKIEVLKGPSATLFGGAVTSFGGMINLVTKKPQESFGGDVSYSIGSFNLHRIAADVYGPLNKKGTLLGRLNAAWQRQESFQDAGFRRTMFLAPALEYRINSKLKVNLNAEFYTAEFTSPAVVFLNRTRPFLAKNPDVLDFNWKRSYTNNDITMETPTVNTRAQVHYQLARGWASQTIVSFNNRQSDGYYQYQFIRKPKSDDSLERNVARLDTRNTMLDIQQNFIGDFKIGGLRNRLVVGLDYVKMTLKNNNSPYIVFDFVNGKLNHDANDRNISRAAVDARLAASTAAPTRNNGTTYIYSAYASDVLNITSNLLAMMSLRVDRFESGGTFDQQADKLVANTTYKQTAVSPKIGLVYQVVKDRISIFANYLNGFSNLAPVTQPLPDISGVLKPQHANQIEGGVKADLLNGKINFTLSYYDIEVDNITRIEEIEREGTRYNITVQNGTQRSRGFELDLITNPLPGLNIVAGYGHNTSKLIRSSPQLEGRRPAGAGPANLVNAWFSYTMPKGKLKGLGAGFGGNHSSEHLTANSTATGVFTFPAYTLLNATIFYDVKRYRLGVKLDNISDEQYFIGQGVMSAQMPRMLTANVTLKF